MNDPWMIQELEERLIAIENCSQISKNARSSCCNTFLRKGSALKRSENICSMK